MPEPRPVAELWRAATDLAPETLGGRTLDWSRMPPPFKDYPEAERITLPAPELRAPGAPGLRDLLASRRSRRDCDQLVDTEQHWRDRLSNSDR